MIFTNSKSHFIGNNYKNFCDTPHKSFHTSVVGLYQVAEYEYRLPGSYFQEKERVLLLEYQVARVSHNSNERRQLDSWRLLLSTLESKSQIIRNSSLFNQTQVVSLVVRTSYVDNQNCQRSCLRVADLCDKINEFQKKTLTPFSAT